MTYNLSVFLAVLHNVLNKPGNEVVLVTERLMLELRIDVITAAAQN